MFEFHSMIIFGYDLNRIGNTQNVIGVQGVHLDKSYTLYTRIRIYNKSFKKCLFTILAYPRRRDYGWIMTRIMDYVALYPTSRSRYPTPYPVMQFGLAGILEFYRQQKSEVDAV